MTPLSQREAQEWLCVAICAVSGAALVLADTIAYTKERKAFGEPIRKFQNTQFELVKCLAEVEVGPPPPTRTSRRSPRASWTRRQIARTWLLARTAR